jgi:hypothetical protein
MSEETKPDQPVDTTIRLSPSDASILCTKTPLHCWQNKRQLGGGARKETDALNDGKILETLIFGQGMSFEVHDVPDWKSAHAKGLKQSSILKGLVPIKQSDYAEYADMAMRMLTNIHKAGVMFSGGEFQKEIRWTKETVNGPVECHAFLDYLILGPDYYIIYDLKCVADADNDSAGRAMTNYGWDIQAAAEIEGVETVYPQLAGRGIFRDVFCEKSAPFACNVPELSGGFHALGKRKWDRAAGIWARCLRDNDWPGYKGGIIEPLPWQMAKETE